MYLVLFGLNALEHFLNMTKITFDLFVMSWLALKGRLLKVDMK